MPVSKHARTNSDSWAVMPPSVQDGLTEMSTVATGPTPRETHDVQISFLPSEADASTWQAVGEGNISGEAAELMQDDKKECASQTSDDSWVEVTAAELESSPSSPLFAEGSAAVAVAATTGGAAHASSTHSLLKVDGEVHDAFAGAEPSSTPPPISAEEKEEAVLQGDSAVTLRSIEDETRASLLSATQGPPPIPPTFPAQPKMDLPECFSRVTLTKAYEPAAAVDDSEEETIDLEYLPPSVSFQSMDNWSLPNRATAVAPSRTRAPVMQPQPTGETAVLRRRVVAEDWMRTLRGPSELAPQERVEVFQALFGFSGDAQISAEQFKEMMVPYERHCDCLGASYDFHHQGCRFYGRSQLTS
ncbi:hypothetical protein ABL78_2610 [Leptomonas seymouri]|uniref:Uncharacterized protein n=1 Tax=Leptomonas seymouri TaxID=5684 RepID=A0A0N1ILI2_LEPSE|nr:hypothetical protein ABL78_2610 [Leptomonas seymouri]|eukprot:KPI88311.1 hypothetical protein ABL78_2610 [Leptomonas seymouri]